MTTRSAGGAQHGTWQLDRTLWCMLNLRQDRHEAACQVKARRARRKCKLKLASDWDSQVAQEIWQLQRQLAQSCKASRRSRVISSCSTKFIKKMRRGHSDPEST
jgi:hypothetical protein